jgi:hypothetical protein
MYAVDRGSNTIIDAKLVCKSCRSTGLSVQKGRDREGRATILVGGCLVTGLSAAIRSL